MIHPWAAGIYHKGSPDIEFFTGHGIFRLDSSHSITFSKKACYFHIVGDHGSCLRCRKKHRKNQALRVMHLAVVPNGSSSKSFCVQPRDFL